MNESQENLIRMLEDARVLYEQFEDKLALEVADRKWDAKQDMRRLIREARQAGVPYRKIGAAIQTSDHQTLKDYEQNKRREKR